MFARARIIIIFFPFIATAQDKIHSFTDGPQNLRKYIVTLKHRTDSISHKQAAEDRLRTFFRSTVYEFKNGSVVIFEGKETEVLINGCSHDSAKPVTFINFVTKKVSYFFHLSLYLPMPKDTSLPARRFLY